MSASSESRDPAPATAARPAPSPEQLPPGTQLRLRPTRVSLLVVLVLAVCMTPIAGQHAYLVPLYAIPLAILWWVLRWGTDVDDTGVTVRAMLGSRHWNWNELRGFSARPRGTLVAVLLDGRTVRLPAARARHLSLIAKVSGGRVPKV